MSQSATAAPRVFRQSMLRRIPLGLILSALVVLLGLGLLPQFKPVTMPKAQFGMLSLAVISILIVLIWFWLLWWANTRVVVTDELVEVRRPFMTVHSWRRDAVGFSSTVTRQYTNGIRSGTTRTLTVHTQGGQTAIALAGMPQAAFSDLLAVLQAPAVRAPEDDAFLRSVPLPAVFAPTRGPLVRRAVVTGAVAAALLLLGLGAVVAGILLDGALIVVGALLLLAATGLGIAAGVAGGRAGRIPGRIEVSRGAIAIDGRVIPLGSLERVWISPPTYTASRRLSVVHPGGSRERWALGAGNDAAKVMPQWEQLVVAVQAAAVDHPELVAYDLE
ncbi:hypothetical protein [Microbacterium gilvum]|uniref:PH domain-containing protein n=1 Tax=Microbacterium gilvum TaxID=1336204 RepID=A0ABP9AHJ7_9MICO